MSTEIKKCGCCKQEKSVLAFSKNRSKVDGLSSWCKFCMKIVSRRQYQLHKEEIAEYHQNHKAEAVEYYQSNRTRILKRCQEYRRSLAGKESQKRADEKKQVGNPKQLKAKGAVDYAIRSGNMIRSIFCEECGLPAKTEGHHPDYNKSLEVVWLCQPCHISLHKSLCIGGR